MTVDQIFYRKKYTFPSLELLFGLNILLWNCFEEFAKVTSKKGPPFHTFLKIFYKNIKILVLSHNLSHFMPISKKIDENLAQIYRVFYFYVVRSYTRNLSQFWFFVKDDVTVTKQKHNFWSRRVFWLAVF